MAEGDPFLAMGRELGDVQGDRVVQLQETALPELREGDRRHRLGGGEPEHEMVPRERLAGAVVAQGGVQDGLTFQRDVDLGSEMEAFADPGLDRLAGPHHEAGWSSKASS